MKRFFLALAALILAGCGSNPMVGFFKETFGSGPFPLQTDAFVKDLRISVPENFEQPLGGGMSIAPGGDRYAYTADKMLFVGKIGHPASQPDNGSGYQWWSPDGTRLAYAVQSVWGRIQRFDLKVLDVESGSTTVIRTDCFINFPWVSWAPDGKSVLYSDALSADGLSMGLFRRVLDETENQQLAELPISGNPPIAWSPDSKSVVYLQSNPAFSSGADLVLRNLDDDQKKVLNRVPFDARLVWYEDTIGFLSNIGESISGEHSFQQLRVSDGSKESQDFMTAPPKDGFYSTATALSPNGKWCILQRDNRPLYARDLSSGRDLKIASGRAEILSWTPDSKAVFAITERGGIRHFYRIQVER